MKQSHPLGDLIEHAMSVNDWSLEDVAARAQARGYKLSRQNVSRIKNDAVVTIKATQMRALSAGLSIPVQTLVRAAVQSMGFTQEEATTDVESAVHQDGRLSERDKRIVLSLLAAMSDDEEAMGNAEHPAPTNPAGDQPALKLHRTGWNGGEAALEPDPDPRDGDENVTPLPDREGVTPDESDLPMAARPGVPTNPPDGTIGEENQDPDGDQPA